MTAPGPFGDQPYSSRSVVGAAAYLSGIGSLFGNVSPIVFGAMAEHLAIGNQRVGYLASALILSGAVRVTAPIWIRRVNWRKLSAGATLIGAVILAASGVTHSYWYALLAVGLYGLMDALYSSVAYAALGDSSNPERAYAISIVASRIWQHRTLATRGSCWYSHASS